MMNILKHGLLMGLAFVVWGSVTQAAGIAADDIVLADFEGKDYGDWKVTGDAFGTGPAHGTLPHQMPVEGFQGHGLVSSFHGGDKSTGTLTSPEFKIKRNFIRFLIGGGGHAGQTCMNLLVDGKVVRTAIGPNSRPGGSEALMPAVWDVSEFLGRTAHIEIVDKATGGWGHINVDEIVLTDKKPLQMLANQAREFTIERHYLNLPVKNGAPKRKLSVLVGGKMVREFTLELADAAPDWWAPLNVGEFTGKCITLSVDKLPGNSGALQAITQNDVIRGAEDLYHESLRPQLHFSSRRGWINDPNGLAFYRGEYHLFYQHNPFGWGWGNMHWGHAVSKDLVHWQEFDDVLVPDESGAMFSGSAVVDWNNTSGLGKDDQPPLVLIYTAAGNPSVQCIVSSTDGRTFTKFSGNPVVPQIAPGNRDPKVIWSETLKRWVMVLYVGFTDTTKTGTHGQPGRRDTIHFLASPNLKDWTVISQTAGFFECPDFFELPVAGDAQNKKWLLTAASSDYMLGAFDGKTFIPGTEKLKGQRGAGFYAAQTFSDIPADDGRRIQMGWLQALAPGMPFNQAMSLPLELKLALTPEGPRLTRTPVKELEALRVKTSRLGPLVLQPGDANPLAGLHGELLEVRAEFTPGDTTEIGFTIRGATISYDAQLQELIVNGQHAFAPLQGGRQRLVIYVDRTALEVFASDGLTYVPKPFIPKTGDLALELYAKGGAAQVISLEVYELKSIWPAKTHETTP